MVFLAKHPTLTKADKTRTHYTHARLLLWRFTVYATAASLCVAGWVGKGHVYLLLCHPELQRET